MKDWIVSGKTGETYAEVNIRRDEHIDYFYTGEIHPYDIPTELASLIDEYDELVKAVVMTSLDDVEEKIYSYDLKLKIMQKTIFSISIENNRTITFFTKYPTGKGFVDNHPY